jgi:hypothetical protein
VTTWKNCKGLIRCWYKSVSDIVSDIFFLQKFQTFVSDSQWSDGLGEEEYIQKWVETLRLCVFQTSCKISPRGISALVIVLLASFVSV